MLFFRFLAIATLASSLAWSDDTPKPPVDDTTRPTASKTGVSVPPVLRVAEPTDDVVLTLPGTPAAPTTAAASETPRRATFVEPVRSEDPDRPVLRRPKREYPEGFEQDSAEYLRQHLGAWSEEEAHELLGESVSSRPSYDEDGNVNGQIFAFNDPTDHYKSVELDFDKETGHLRTVFIYPGQMSWQECRRLFGANVRATQTAKGRTFYSYADRRLDVLVDPSGKVISLGMY